MDREKGDRKGVSLKLGTWFTAMITDRRSAQLHVTPRVLSAGAWGLMAIRWYV